MTNSPPDDRVQLTLRLPKDLHEELVKRLHRRNSLNQDIVNRLWENLELRGREEASIYQLALPQPPIRITLDANGRPTSWPEISGLVAEIVERMPAPVISLSIEVLTPEIIAAYKRHEEEFNAGMPGFTRVSDGDEAPDAGSQPKRRPRKISADRLRGLVRKKNDD